MSKYNLEKDRKEIIHNLELRIGDDVNNLAKVYELEKELMHKKTKLQRILDVASDEVPNKLSSAIKKAEQNSKEIASIKEKRTALMNKVESFLLKTEPLMKELDKRFSAIGRLEGVLAYFKLYARIEELSNEMKQCKDDEQLVALYSEMKDLCTRHQNSHQGTFIKEYTHYWHNVLKDHLIKHYEEVLKILKWPLTSRQESLQMPKEAVNKFSNLTRYLFLIQEPKDVMDGSISGDFIPGEEPCLPVRILLRPLKKRFAFHFTGNRQTARIDRPEWFLTETLVWIKNHQDFVRTRVQPIAEKLQIKDVNAVAEFNAGLIALAAERLHTVLAIYHVQGAKGEIVDEDAAFAHAVDESLGFHRELTAICGNVDGVISVLTKAETFVRWLAVEKKYALTKMEETLSNEQWIEAVASGVEAAVGSVVWVPRGADWFVGLLKTIGQRYTLLPQPGHRLQFLELQLELIEEWRIRLTQLLNAAKATLTPETFLVAGPHPLIAIINAGHYTHTVLLQWAHALFYLQLHYYRRQFQHFTHQQHKDEENEGEKKIEEEKEEEEEPSTSTEGEEYTTAETTMPRTINAEEAEQDDVIYFNQIEESARKMAESELTRRNSSVMKSFGDHIYFSTPGNPATEPEENSEDVVFGEAAALQARMRDEGIATLVEHILLEFKATIRDYKKLKWHSMLTLEQVALSVSSPLCGPLSSLCARLSTASLTLAPRLAMQLRTRVATHVDIFIFEEMVLNTWFNTGGTIQFIYDVKRNLVPAFAPPNTKASKLSLLPRLIEACVILNLDYEDARRLRSLLTKQPQEALQNLRKRGITHIEPEQVSTILKQRTDLTDLPPAPLLMELF